MDSFNLALIVKIIGWFLVLAPFTAVFIVSLAMIIGAAKDDEGNGNAIGGLVTMGASMFFLGAAMLLLAYFTNILTRLA